jgi:SH3-like domain-containing protein
VTVLEQARSWTRVQSPDGQQGWVYSLMLEVK